MPFLFPSHRARPPSDVDAPSQHAATSASQQLALANSLAVQQRVVRWQRSIRLTFLCAGMLLLALIVPASPVRQDLNGYGGGFGLFAPSITPTCGHPADVFAKLLTGEKYTLPSRAQLMQLPTPPQKTIALASDATYDPGSDQLCTGGWVALDVRFVHPQQAVNGSTTYDPTYGFTNTIVASALGSLGSSFEQWVRDSLQSLIDAASSWGFLFITPKAITYGHAVVLALEKWVLLVMDSLLTLFLVIGGYNSMFGEYQRFRELAPRLVVAAIAANASLFVLGQFIEVNNTLCTGVLGILASAGIGDLKLPLGLINWATAPAYLMVVYLIELVFTVLLIVQMLLRIALLDLLLVLAPLGLLCFALPQTRAWGTLWAQAFVATLIAQFLQLLCLGLGAALIASFGHASITPVSILVGIAAVFLAGKIPDMLLSNVMRARVLSSNSAKEFGQHVVNVAQTGAEMVALVAA
jgi:hypothetical protein